MTPPLSRRDFLAGSAAAAGALSTTASSASAAAVAARRALPKGPTDKVTLGQTGIQVSLVGMGTGSKGTRQSSNQTRAGFIAFEKVVRHALDRGICFFDVADQYGSHVYLRDALKGVPRDRYVIQTKTHATDADDCKRDIERYRGELGVDYIDMVLLHCMQKTEWPAEHTGAMEYLAEAKAQKLIRAHGTSNHGMDPLRVSARHPFVEIDLARINPEGLIMDGRTVDEVTSELQEMHDRGKGVIGMKILGEGRINTPERIDNSLRFVLGLGTVDAFIIGFESTNQVDDLLKRVENALSFLNSRHG